MDLYKVRALLTRLSGVQRATTLRRPQRITEYATPFPNAESLILMTPGFGSPFPLFLEALSLA